MRTFLRVFCILIISNLFSSCSVVKTIYYAISNRSDIGLTHKNDVKVNANFAADRNGNESENEIYNADLQISWSPINNLGIYARTNGYEERYEEHWLDYDNITGEGFTSWGRPLGELHYDFRFKQDFVETGIGYYKNIHKLLWIETYGFYGHGKASHTMNTTGFLEYTVHNLGLSNSLIIRGRYLEAGYTYSLSSLDFKNINYENLGELEDRVLPIYYNDSGFLSQHGFYGKIGTDMFKVKSELSFAQLPGRDVKIASMIMSLGVEVNVAAIFKAGTPK